MERSESKYFITASKMDRALIDLLNEKDFEYITVKEICERAGVNRSTFYLHYETIADLLAECLEYIDDQFVSYFDEDHVAFVNDISDKKPDELIFINKDYLVPYLNFIRDNLKVFRATVNHPEVFRADDRYKALYKYIADPIMEKHQVPKERRYYYNTYYIQGMMGVITEWIRRDCQESTEEISEIIETLILK